MYKRQTFLSTVSRARPKVADYPFTTLTPNLGVIQLSDFRSFVLADIPGIIEGAHEGKGLGHQFLRHVERTRTLAFMVPVDSPDPQAEYDRLRTEIARYSPVLADVPHCLVLTKADLLPPDEEPPRLEAPEAWQRFVVSSVAKGGVDELLEGLWQRVQLEREVGEPESNDGSEDRWSP